MSRRPGPNVKKPLEVLADVLDGHREAAISGPAAARKYLERVLQEGNSIPNATKFFVYDLLADACAQLGESERASEAVEAAHGYITAAQEDAARQWKEYLPSIRLFEVGIGLAMETGDYERAYALCQEAIELGLGRVYENKADTIRRFL